MNSPLHRRGFLKAGAAMAATPAIRSFGFKAWLSPGAVVTSDSRSVLVHGKRRLIISGEMHYGRSNRELWPALLDRSKDLGINTIATYVFWNMHEPSRGVFDFSGDADLSHYLDLCRQRNLLVFLRVGPYACAEWNFGGFPAWLRDEPGITIRTMNQPYLDRVESFFRRLYTEIRPHLASEGGPVVMVQVENEYANVAKRYGAAGQEYLKWIVDLANRIGFGTVPLTECEGGAPGAIETGNGDTFPPDKIARFRSKAPDAPLIWSESYPGWYDLWGGESHEPRDPHDLAFQTLDFIAGGGAGWNYYMWHGGTNFGRTSMYLQTTSYDFHAPLDEFGRPTFMGNYLGRMHRALAGHSDLILNGTCVQTTLPSGILRTQWRSGDDTLALLVNRGEMPATADTIFLPPKSGFLVSSAGEILFQTEGDFSQEKRSFSSPAWTPIAGPFQWKTWSEPMPIERADNAIHNADPLEQLSLTKDRTDYCWYSSTLSWRGDAPKKLTIPYGGDFFYLFVDDRLIAQTATPLHENRGPITPEDPAHPRIVANRHETETFGFRHEFVLPQMAAGTHRVDLLCTAMGMVKGDWQIASPMNFERKGIWEGVQLDGIPLKNWDMRPLLTGELSRLVAKPDEVQWKSSGRNPPVRLAWHRSNFKLTAAMLKRNADFRLNATGLGKGSLFLNGRCLGRHWLVLAQGPNPKSSQQYYHIPFAWLREQNELIIFEEQDRAPDAVTIETRTFPDRP